MNSLELEGLCDTGSSRTLLAASVFYEIVNKEHRTSLLSPSSLRLQSVTGHSLTVLGSTQIYIKDAGCIDVVVVDNLHNDIILGIDAITQGNGRLDFHTKTFEWFGKTWPLQGERASQIISLISEPYHSGIDPIDRVIDKYSKIFSKKNSTLPPCLVKPIKIITEGPPICQRAYRAPLTKRTEISKAVDDMLAQGIIQPSCSPWASPVTLVPKPDGSIRFCVDYRKLNQVSKKDRYPVPLASDCFDLMQGTSVFSTIDLRSGFHQVTVDPADREKTAFICHRGLFEFVRMPFGLANGPSHFQRAMDFVFGDLLGKCVMVYIDDIVIFSKNMDEHAKHLDLVLSRLAKHGLQAKTEKCKFAKSEIKLLGYILNEQGIKANPEKTSAIAKMPPPRTAKQVRSFLGMAGYYRQCIRNYADLAQPLTELTKKRKRFYWSPACQTAFDNLKAALVSDSIVRHPRVDLPYQLYTDASNYCVGAILCQTHEDGTEYVVQYISHQLSSVQTRWATIEKEAYAVVYALQKLKAYLYGAEFVVYTDHKPLLCLFSKSMANTKIQRWAILLAEFGATIKYKPGSSNIRADMLSRLSPDTVALIDAHTDYIEPIGGPADIADDLLPFCMDSLNREAVSAAQQVEFPGQWGKAGVEDSGYIINKGILYSVWTPSTTSPAYPRIILPKHFQDAVIDRAHLEVGHMATHKTLCRLREAYVWPRMRESIKARLAKCATCAVHYKRQDHVAMGDMPLPASPIQVVAMDLIGPFVASLNNNRYILTMVDHCTGWAEAYPIPDKRNATIAHVFHNSFVSSHGCPEVLVTDNGTEFVARDFTDYLSSMGIKHIRSTPRHPESNGKIERFNRTFKEMLAKAVRNAPEDWEEHVGATLFSHRISVSDVTHYSPFYLLYGRQPRAPLTRLLHERDPVQGFGARVDNLAIALREARVRTEDSRKYNKARLAKKANDGLLTPGDMVVLLAPEPLTLTSKWDPQWQVTRVAKTTVFLRHQQSGHTKKVHRSKVRLVDPDMVWDEVPPRPRRKQLRGGQTVNVNIPFDTPRTTQLPPATQVPVPQEPVRPPQAGTQLPPRPQHRPTTPQPSTSGQNLEMEVNEDSGEYTPAINEPSHHPHGIPGVENEPSRSRPIRGEREPERGCRTSHKRQRSPEGSFSPRYHTRWSSLTDQEKRQKRVRYDILAGRTASNSTIRIYTIEATGFEHQESATGAPNRA